MDTKQVQKTNDSSIVSKLSMVELGYFEDRFIKDFVEKPTRRSSLINRCYFARAAAISHCVERFLQADDFPKQIISLGAGFDTTYFRMKEKELLKNVLFIEIDFPELLRRKIALAHMGGNFANSDISSIDQKNSIVFRTDDYVAIGYDLQLVGKEFCAILSSVGIDFEKPTLFLSEVVLAYLPSDKSSLVLEWAAKEFSNAFFTIFEQTCPNDSFGKVLIRFFKQIGSPLLTIEDYPMIADRIERHRKFALDCSSAVGLERFYQTCVDEVTKKRIQHMEIFDEFEAWHLACQHYYILCSTNSKNKTLQDLTTGMFLNESSPCQNLVNDVPSTVQVNFKCGNKGKSPIRRFGQCSCKISMNDREYAVLIGGFGIPNESTIHQRLHDDVCIVDLSSHEVHHCYPKLSTGDKTFLFPMSSTTVNTKDGILVFGGRSSPTKYTNNLTSLTISCTTRDTAWTYETRLVECSQYCPKPRWRHCASMLSASFEEDFMLVFGGLGGETVFGDMWSYHVTNKTWKLVCLQGEKIAERHSSSMCTSSSDSVFLSGGLDEDEHMFNDLFLIKFAEKSENMAQVTRVVLNQPLLPLYSHTTHCHKDFLLICGGIRDFIHSKYGDDADSDAISVVDLETGNHKSFHIAAGNSIAMLPNNSSEICKVSDELVVLAGGSNCFSFGTWFNSSPYSIPISKICNVE